LTGEQAGQANYRRRDVRANDIREVERLVQKAFQRAAGAGTEEGTVAIGDAISMLLNAVLWKLEDIHTELEERS
jgi:hypothetical protein